jgi:hypothetical protein
MRRSLSTQVLSSFIVVALGAPLVATSVSAQPKAAAPAAPSASASGSPDDAKKNEAKEHFVKGVDLMQLEQWDAALVEFNASLALFATRNARKNAATCLRQLGRFAEALDEYELLLKEYGGQLSPQDLDFVNKSIADLKNVTGFIVIETSVAGATVVIDSKPRGTTPLPGPVRVGQGTHTIRVIKEGYIPFETTSPVLGKQTVKIEAKLSVLARSGSLTVIETNGADAEVIVDGAPKGKVSKDPYSEKLAPGTHWVALKGAGKMGTQPAPVTVALDQTATLRLTLEELPGEARIETEPVGAAIVLDGVPVGQGSWEGRLRAGSHKVDATSEGYFRTTKTFEVVADGKASIKVNLDRDENSPFWTAGRARKISLGVFGSGVYGLFGMGGDYERSCNKEGVNCYARSRALGFIGGVRGGYEVAPGLSIELDVGYAYIQSSLSRKTTLSGEGQVPVKVDITDTWTVTGFVVGAGLAYRFLRKPIMIYGALTGGAILGARVRDRRSGNLPCIAPTVGDDCSGAEVRDPPSPRAMAPFSAQESKTIPWIAPEFRFGLPLGDAMQVGLSIGAFIGTTDARPRIQQTPLGSGTDQQPAIPPLPGDKPTDRRPIGFVPQPGTNPESAVQTFVLPRVALYFRLAF